MGPEGACSELRTYLRGRSCDQQKRGLGPE